MHWNLNWIWGICLSTRQPFNLRHFFWDKKYDPDNPSAARRGGISDGAPDFMRNNEKVATHKSTMKE